MTVRLTVYRDVWRAHIARVATACDGLVPVVKGNGYGFGRPLLTSYAAQLAPTVAVGTIHELHDVPADIVPMVLTPALRPPDRDDAIVTVGSLEHVERLAGWRGRTVVKLATSMHRYGAAPDELGGLLTAIEAAGLTLDGFALHLPIAGTDDDRVAEIEAWLGHLPAAATVSVSHLEPGAYEGLRGAHPGFDWQLRVGTALWHGDKSMLRLTVDVIDTHPVVAGDVVGYHHTRVDVDGTLVMVGGGTAHHVVPLRDGRSPFHFARRRLPLVEPPHMHTSMVVVPAGDPIPAVGDAVDLQRPVLATEVDEITWL